MGWHGLLPAALGLARTLEREMDRALAIVRLSAAGFVVLLTIAREAPATQEDLARRLGLGAPTVSEQLRRLARAGLVRRDRAVALTEAGQARRNRPVALTEAGQAVLAAAEDIAVGVERAWARRLAIAAGDPDRTIRAGTLTRRLAESRSAIAAAARPARG